MHIIPKDDPKQALRIKRFLMAFGTYILWILIALFCYHTGLVVRVPGSIYYIFVLIIATNLAIFFVIRSGLNKRFADPSLTMAQIIIATVWTMVLAYVMDEGREIMLLLYMVVFTFGTLSLSFRQFLLLSFIAPAGYGLVIMLLLIHSPQNVNLRLETIHTGTLFIVLVWFSFIGSYINGLRKKLSKANIHIRHSEERFRDLAELLPETVFETDLEGNVTFANQSAYDQFGYTRNDFGNKVSMLDGIMPDDHERLIKSFQSILAGKAEGLHEYTARRKDGTLFPILVHTTRIIREGVPLGLRGFLIDITERKNAEEALRRSEARYRNILETMEESYYEVDLNGSFTFFNSSAVRNLGYTNEELIGLNYREFTDEINAKKVLATYHKVYVTGEMVRGFDWVLTDKYGLRIPVEASVSLKRDEAGNVVGFKGVVREITERKLAEEALQRSEEKYRTIFENTGTATVLCTEDMTIRLANSHFEKLAGYSKEELEGRMNWSGFMEEADFERLKAFHTRSMDSADHLPVSFESRCRSRSGDMRDMLLSVAAIPGTLIAVVSCLDMTDRKRAEQEMRSREKLQGVLEMSGAVCHELNQPLQILMSTTDLLVDYSHMDEEGRELVDTIQSVVGQIGSLTDKIMRVTDYEVKDYMGGKSRIIDINRSSAKVDRESGQENLPE